MKPPTLGSLKAWKTLARARGPDGAELMLQQRGEEFVIRSGGHVLMGSRSHGSEEAMAEAALPVETFAAAQLLIGGLGLGYTLRAALNRASPRARVWVAELVHEVVLWNRGPLAPLAGSPLDDPRVQVVEGDV